MYIQYAYALPSIFPLSWLYNHCSRFYFLVFILKVSDKISWINPRVPQVYTNILEKILV